MVQESVQVVGKSSQTRKSYDAYYDEFRDIWHASISLQENRAHGSAINILQIFIVTGSICLSNFPYWYLFEHKHYSI